GRPRRCRAPPGRAPWIRRPLCVALLALDDACLERQLVDRPGERAAGELLADAGDLEEDPAGLDVRDPPLRRALTRTHAGFGGLLGERMVGVDVDPHLSAALDVTGHRDTRRLDLAVGHVGGGEGLDAPLAEGDLRAAGGLPGTTRVVLLAVLDLTGDEHGYASTPAAASARGPRRAPSRRSGRDDFWAACSRASSLLVMSPL